MRPSILRNHCRRAGAGPRHDGASGVQTHMTNSRLTDPEVLEQRFPVLLREFSLRAGSGGRGGSAAATAWCARWSFAKQ
jgi:N-methylhydantoinase B/oxoprolinase/acetone carboxylase alpha subunit